MANWNDEKEYGAQYVRVSKTFSVRRDDIVYAEKVLVQRDTPQGDTFMGPKEGKFILRNGFAVTIPWEHIPLPLREAFWADME